MRNENTKLNENNQKNSEILLNKNNKCPFSYLYIYIHIYYMRRQLHLLIKQMEKIRKKGKDIGCEYWKQWNLMGLILQIVYSRLILYFACLFIYYFFQSTVTFIVYYFYSSLDLFIHLFVYLILLSLLIYLLLLLLFYLFIYLFSTI